MSIEELSLFFSEHFRPEVHYLQDIHRENESWQEEQQQGRA